ncbi:ribosome hibernation factor-recruiting GTPase MRF [Amycolatopsis sp. ATCC 39116]|uniref:ribosome hibernation factor-recruiting GTPase MRF n=1 Tax=Amycolatopsis sp. (strain ATCC 39116 / 75iv2) TaxID=385957 RepID=UPI000262618E|nr:GTP-binding protein [Amycolatopsis sp. ATCC 39116]
MDPETTGTTRVPLTLISGLVPAATADLAEQARAARPGTAVVHHDLREIRGGVVRRRLRLGDRDETAVLELAHGCVSCTLREDLLPLLRRLAGTPGVRHIVVRLDEAMEPEPVCWAIRHVLVGDRPVSDFVAIDGVHTVLDRGSWLADATGDDTLEERGLQASQDDERTVAQVALSQAEFADVLVLTGTADAWTDAKTAAVLDRVAPAALRTSRLADVPPDARRGEVTDMHGPLLHGEPPLGADCGVATLLFTAQRPFHPERLHDALDVLLDGVVRTRGRVWVASQPDMALWLESAGGGLGVGHAGPWLDAPDGPAWTDVSPERRTLASLRWHPVFGDRASEIFVVTDQATPAEIEEALSGALLTDAELAAGQREWLTYDDPFGAWHEEPCEETDETQDVNVTSGTEKQ